MKLIAAHSVGSGVTVLSVGAIVWQCGRSFGPKARSQKPGELWAKVGDGVKG